MKCQFCNQELPDGAKFCYKCYNQIVCLDCGKLLVEGSSICIYCGKEIKTRSTQANVNHIKYSENDKGKSFEASFSDETAGNVVDVFAQFLPIKRNHNIQTSNSMLQISQAEDAHMEEIDDTAPENKSVAPNIKEDLNVLRKIFIEKGDSIKLYEKRLKAKSKSDQQARICLLFLLYNKIVIRKEVSREDLNNMLDKEKLYDGNFRAWLSHHQSYFIIDNNIIELSPEGEEQAQTMLHEVYDDNVVGAWNANSNSQTSIAQTSSKRKNPQIVKDLNLLPNGKESLDDFMKRHKYGKSSLQINLLFVYYLKQILGVESVNQDYIYTCYRHMKLTIPNNLYSSISDTISKNGWIENISNLNVTTQGINEVEQKMAVK